MSGPRMLDDQIRYNKRKTAFIVALLLAILFGVVFAVGILLQLGFLFAAAMALAAGLVYVMVAAGSSTHLVLQATRARPANPAVREEKLLLYKVEELAIASGLPVPKVYVQDSRDINAFAAGKRPEEAIVAVTTGALQQLDQEELEGVLAHEMSHIKNYDVRLATYTIAIVGLIAILVEIAFRVMWMGGGRGHGRGKGGGAEQVLILVVAVLFVVLAPFISRLVYFAMSRRREYLADASGAYITRNPEGLARALEKILHDLPDDPKGSKTVAALYIANPWKRALRDNVWSTHPPLEKRIQLLRGPGWQAQAPPSPRLKAARADTLEHTRR